MGACTCISVCQACNLSLLSSLDAAHLALDHRVEHFKIGPQGPQRVPEESWRGLLHEVITSPADDEAQPHSGEEARQTSHEQGVQDDTEHSDGGAEKVQTPAPAGSMLREIVKMELAVVREVDLQPWRDANHPPPRVYVVGLEEDESGHTALGSR